MNEILGTIMDELFTVITVAIQIVVLVFLIKENRHLSNQVNQARRDTLIRVGTQLGDIYVRFLTDDNEVMQDIYRGQMKYLLSSYDELSKRLGDRQEDEFLHRIRQECNRSEDQ